MKQLYHILQVASSQEQNNKDLMTTKKLFKN
jgi:hypothetical protein